MTTKQIMIIKKLALQAEKAAHIVQHNRFLIETYLSFDQAVEGKINEYSSAKDMFKKLSI